MRWLSVSRTPSLSWAGGAPFMHDLCSGGRRHLTTTARCSLFDVHEQELAAELVRRADADNIVAFVGIHLLRAGWYVTW